MKILITGALGLMGSHLADAFIARGHEVSGIDNLSGGSLDNYPQGLSGLLVDDLVNTDSVKDSLKDVDVVIHTACTAYEGLSVFSPAHITQNTFQITSSVLSAAAASGVKKFIFLSSMARYGYQEVTPFTEDMIPAPQDPYGIAKVAAENLTANLCDTHGIDWTIVVPHNIIGPRQKYDDPYRNVASIMINRMLKGEQPIIYGDGTQQRCFSFVQDVVDPIVQIVETDVANKEVVNLGPDDQLITINELASTIAELIGFKDLNPIYLPDRPQEVKVATCSADKARALLGYDPTTTLKDGLQTMIDHIRTKGTKDFNYHIPLEIVSAKTPKSWLDRLI
jgi:UDP-glucose 4-epimerase